MPGVCGWVDGCSVPSSGLFARKILEPVFGVSIYQSSVHPSC